MQFNGQIGKTAAGVYPVRGDNGAGRTCIQTRHATPAMGQSGCIRWQRQINVDLAEEEPRSGLSVQQIAVLANPAQPRPLGQRFFQHRSTVREDPAAKRANGGGNPIRQPLQPVSQHLVIIPAQRIAER